MNIDIPEHLELALKVLAKSDGSSTSDYVVKLIVESLKKKANDHYDYDERRW